MFYDMPEFGLYEAFVSGVAIEIPLKCGEELDASHLENSTKTPLMRGLRGDEALLKVRWASLGKRYNWTKKSYDNLISIHA
jgi:hypothetical protein